MQGIYVRDALLSVLVPMFSKKGKEIKYPDEPYTAKVEDVKEEEKMDIQTKREVVGRQAIYDCY